jgi:AcrR family transcriptional regulator
LDAPFPDVMSQGGAAMLDQTTPKGRILTAALECAAGKTWADVTLLEIAGAAKTTLVDLRSEFDSKARIIAALLRAVDDEVLKRAPKRAESQDARDALFDVVMTRLDVLAPYKRALRSIHASGPADPSLARPLLTSMHWMLQAAGIDTEGPAGGLRVAGLAVIYASVFRVWLEDDDPGHARTMASLDRRLRRGERTLRSVEQFGAVFYRLATEGPPFLRSVLRGQPRQRSSSDPDAGAL